MGGPPSSISLSGLGGLVIQQTIYGMACCSKFYSDGVSVADPVEFQGFHGNPLLKLI